MIILIGGSRSKNFQSKSDMPLAVEGTQPARGGLRFDCLGQKLWLLATALVAIEPSEFGAIIAVRP